ncbi:hypothetical protein LQF76_10990 [Gloeomargaritales cyanobacterium VI4D9]|nr:hypothetical protein LQF76_10990 [Gloeomargaritales cyanobacterium VI4D9]
MIKIPKRSKGRQSPAQLAQYERECQSFARELLKIRASLDFEISARGWCYILEAHGLAKGDFNSAQALICDLRKNGMLPLDICAEDSARSWEGIPRINKENPVDYVANLLRDLRYYADFYHPIDFWEDQDYYLECLVEKVDLVGLFKPVCQEYHIPIANGRGQTDLNCRAAMMQRFKQREAQGKIPVLLYCGDFDPFGLVISDSLRGNLESLKQAVGWAPDNLIIDRFGLNYDFIQENQLTWIDNLETGSGKRLDDPNHPFYSAIKQYIDKYGTKKVEANALVVRTDAGRQLITTAINKYVSPKSLELFNERERKEQSKVREIVSHLQDTVDFSGFWEGMGIR